MTNPIAQNEVESTLVTTGMGRGLHTKLAITLTIIAVAFGIIAQTMSPLSLGFLMLAAGVGLLGEVSVLLSTGEVRARRRETMKANRFLVIRRENSPARFYSYVAIYFVLGSFALLYSCMAFWSVFINYVN